MSLKILHVIHQYAPVIGGSESWCRDVARYAQRHGCAVRVFTTTATIGYEHVVDLPDGERTMCLGPLSFQDGVEIHRFPLTRFNRGVVWIIDWLLHHRVRGRSGRFWFPRFGPHSLKLYRALGRAVRWADVVHLHALPYPHVLVGYAWAIIARKPVVITPHFHIDHPHYERWFIYAMLRRCEKVFVMTERERRHLMARGVPSSRLLVTGNAVDPSEYTPDRGRPAREPMENGTAAPERGSPEVSGATRGPGVTHPAARTAAGPSSGVPNAGSDPYRVLFLGRKEEYKGLPTLLEAFGQVRRHAPHATLDLVGPRTHWFKQFWAECPGELKAGVHELEMVSHEHKVRLLCSADLLVLPSRAEAFGIVLLEAWMCGTAVIVPAGGAPADVATDCGLTFRLDDADDLAAKLLRLWQDVPLRRALAERGHARVLERYTSDQVGSAILGTYWRVLRRRRRVLLVSHMYAPDSFGGSEVIAELDVRGLRRRGCDVRVFTGGVDHAQPRYALRTSPEAAVVRVNIHRQDFCQRDRLNHRHAALERQFGRCVDAFRPDIVHLHNLFALTTGLVDVCRQRGIPTVMTLHDYWPICIKNVLLTNDERICGHNGLDCFTCQAEVSDDDPVPLPVRNTLIKLAMRHVHRFLAPVHYLGERFVEHGYPRGRLRVVSYGIETARFSRMARRRRRRRHGAPVVFAYLGYLGMHKGVEYLVRAAAQVRRRERVQVWIAGEMRDPGYELYLRAFIRQFHLQGVVRLLPGVPHQRVPHWYRQIDVFVLPSVWPENQPVTILEAMASGRAVLASAVGGVPEMIRHGETGWLVPRADAQALAAAMDRLTDDPHLRERLGRQAAEAVREYASLDNRMSALEQINEEVIAGVRQPEVSVNLIACVGFKGHDATLPMLLELWQAYTATTGRELPDVCDPEYLTDGELREGKALIVPEWHARFADQIDRAARCGVPILGPPLARSIAWIPRTASIHTYASPEAFVERLSALLHPAPQDHERAQQPLQPVFDRVVALPRTLATNGSAPRVALPAEPASI